MSTGTQERVEIEHLDFDPPCEVKAAATHTADHIVFCRSCGNGALICAPHLIKWREAVARDVANGATVVCAHCLQRSRSFDEACELKPL